jgi:hypothetical protein
MARPKKSSADVVTKLQEPTPVAPAPTSQPPAAQDPQSINISDIQKLAACVDLACRRGAFGAAEAQEVGAIYTKVAGFLAMVAAQQREAQEQQGK